MLTLSLRRIVVFGALLGIATFCYVNAQGPANRFPGPTSSQNIAVTTDGTLLAVVNPDSDSVTFFDVGGDRNRKLAEVNTESEPNSVTFNPQGTRAYVANTVSGSVSVYAINRGAPIVARELTNIKVGTEPYALAMTPNGTRLYVANARSNDISVIDIITHRVYRTIPDVGFEPRGLAITNDGDEDDLDETVWVSQFLALPAANGKPDGEG